MKKTLLGLAAVSLLTSGLAFSEGLVFYGQTVAGEKVRLAGKNLDSSYSDDNSGWDREDGRDGWDHDESYNRWQSERLFATNIYGDSDNCSSYNGDVETTRLGVKLERDNGIVRPVSLRNVRVTFCDGDTQFEDRVLVLDSERDSASVDLNGYARRIRTIDFEWTKSRAYVAPSYPNYGGGVYVPPPAPLPPIVVVPAPRPNPAPIIIRPAPIVVRPPVIVRPAPSYPNHGGVYVPPPAPRPPVVVVPAPRPNPGHGGIHVAPPVPAKPPVVVAPPAPRPTPGPAPRPGNSGPIRVAPPVKR